MGYLTKHPLVVLALSFFLMWLSARIGLYFHERRRDLDEGALADLDLIVTATRTLLGLIIGFTFSMAISRYDQRKTYEEAEANAIGTEYLRADLLPADTAANTRALLRKYLDQRILFYRASGGDLAPANAGTPEPQNALWSAIRPSAAAQPTPIVGLVVSGMNDVLNSQGYTQAAWWNRIPFAAWCLMLQIAIFGNILLGYYL